MKVNGGLPAAFTAVAAISTAEFGGAKNAE